jgi:hypothetical protein
MGQSSWLSPAFTSSWLNCAGSKSAADLALVGVPEFGVR